MIERKRFPEEVYLISQKALTIIGSPAMAKEGLYLGLYIPFNSFSGDAILDSGSELGLRSGFDFGSIKV
jgi:hypothetical protein